MGEAAREREFREFAEARQRQLRRSAYLLCGDWHEAQDLTQTTLMKLYAAWGRFAGTATSRRTRGPS